MKKYYVFVFIALSLLFSGIAFASTPMEQVKEKIAVIKFLGTQNGWRVTHNDYYDQMNQGGEDSYDFNLEKGMKYTITAVGDKDSNDIDLVLYDENGHEVSRDYKNDGVPVVEVTPRWSGSFSLKVKMYSCLNNPCYFGICIVGKNSDQ
jgi:hypothetical protein